MNSASWGIDVQLWWTPDEAGQCYVASEGLTFSQLVAPFPSCCCSFTNKNKDGSSHSCRFSSLPPVASAFFGANVILIRIDRSVREVGIRNFGTSFRSPVIRKRTQFSQSELLLSRPHSQRKFCVSDGSKNFDDRTIDSRKIPNDVDYRHLYEDQSYRRMEMTLMLLPAPSLK